VTLDWSCAGLAEGLACYRARRFFDAHEHWEGVWLTLEEPEKSFLQGLIQITVAFHHLSVGNRTGAASLLRRALKRLELRPAVFGGIDVAPLRAEIQACLHAIEHDAPGDIAAFPNIRPVSERPA
jgi:predicted metal-dependent hydrolase